MQLKVIRFSDGGDSTLGLMYVDGKFQCYTLEDEFHEKKVYADTRIPAGTYKITLRTVGSFHERMQRHTNTELREIHRGMLWLRDVPGFEYILIHPGNTEADTAGCIMVGNNVNNNQLNNGQLTNSTSAYYVLYKKVIDAIDKGEEIHITIIDFDRNFQTMTGAV